MNTENNHNLSKPAYSALNSTVRYALAIIVLLVTMTANMSASSENHAELTFLERTSAESEEASVTTDYTEKVSPYMYVNRSAYEEMQAAGQTEKKANTVTVSVDGNIISDARYESASGTTYVPLRQYFVSSLLKNTLVTWNASESCVEITTENLSISVKENSNYILSNERAFFSEAKTFIEDGVMYIPIRLLTSATASKIEWSETEQKVIVTSGDGTLESGETYYNQDDLYWLSRIIHAESRGEPFEGKIAVGCVIMNRIESEGFPNTVYDVIFDTKHGVQFTPAASGTVYNDPEPESIIAAKICLEGYTLSKTIKYFINEKLATTTWVTTSRPHEISIGNHDFYS